jgi:hypothetical protein
VRHEREKNVTDSFDDIVSLGRACQPAHQIRRLFGVQTAQVFDWIITPDAALRTLLETRLDGFFSRDRLIMGPEACVIDAVTDVRFLHEFPAGSDVNAKYAEHAPRFEMLTERWRALMASRRRVLFIRQHAWDPDPRDTAIRLRRTLDAVAPELNYKLLYLTEHDEAPWGEERIFNRRLSQPDVPDWRGDDHAWSALLDEFGSPAGASAAQG